MIKNETGPPGTTINAVNDCAPRGNLMISRPDALSQRGFAGNHTDPLVGAFRGSACKLAGTENG